MGRTAVGGVWVASVAIMLFASGSQAAIAARVVFWIMVVAHAIECVVFLPRMRRAGGSLGAHLFQTFLFGVFHLRTLAPEQSADA
jgi:uncharacterized protein YhhL (DUF1145 family)